MVRIFVFVVGLMVLLVLSGVCDAVVALICGCSIQLVLVCSCGIRMGFHLVILG